MLDSAGFYPCFAEIDLFKTKRTFKTVFNSLAQKLDLCQSAVNSTLYVCEYFSRYRWVFFPADMLVAAQALLAAHTFNVRAQDAPSETMGIVLRVPFEC